MIASSTRSVQQKAPARAPGAPPPQQQTAASGGSTCDWCNSSFSEQPRHSCADCPFELCSNCVINALTLFPATANNIIIRK